MTPEKKSEMRETLLFVYRTILTVLIGATFWSTMTMVKLLKSVAPALEEHAKRLTKLEEQDHLMMMDLSNHKQSDYVEHSRIWEHFSNEKEVR